MSELTHYISERKQSDHKFADGFDIGYDDFKIGVMLKEARLAAALTQQELADRLHTKKTAISRMENHAEDIKLSTLEKAAKACGKRLILSLV